MMKTDFIYFFLFFLNLATRHFKIAYVAHITWLLASATLDSLNSAIFSSLTVTLPITTL